MSQSMETWRIFGFRPPPFGHQTSSCTTGINLIDDHGCLGLSKQILECSHFWRIGLTLYWHKFQYIWGPQARDSQEFILLIGTGFIVVFPLFPSVAGSFSNFLWQLSNCNYKSITAALEASVWYHPPSRFDWCLARMDWTETDALLW